MLAKRNPSGWARPTPVVISAALFLPLLLEGGGNNLTDITTVAIYGATLIYVALYVDARISTNNVKIVFILFAALISFVTSTFTYGAFDAHTLVWNLVGNKSFSSEDRSRTFIQLLKLLGLGTSFCSGYLLAQSTKNVTEFLRVFLLVAVIYGLIGFLSFVVSPTTVMGFGLKTISLDRLTASFQSANSAGTFFGIVAILAAGFCIPSLNILAKGRAEKRALEDFVVSASLPLTALLICITTLVLTASRTSIITAFLMLLILSFSQIMITNREKRFTQFFFAFAMGLVGIAIFWLSGEEFFIRLSEMDHATASRTAIYKAHVEVALSFPVAGVGLGTFELVNKTKISAEQYSNFWSIRAMHNAYLQWLEGAGFVGSAIMFSIVLIVLAALFRRSLTAGRQNDYIRIMIGISILILVESLFDFALEVYSLAGIWACFLGVGLGLSESYRGVNRKTYT